VKNPNLTKEQLKQFQASTRETKTQAQFVLLYAKSSRPQGHRQTTPCFHTHTALWNVGKRDRAEKRLRMLEISISKSFDRPFV